MTMREIGKIGDVQAFRGHDLKGLYPEGTKVHARILYVDPESKKIFLTMRPTLLSRTPEPEPPALGTVFPVGTPLLLPVVGCVPVSI